MYQKRKILTKNEIYGKLVQKRKKAQKKTLRRQTECFSQLNIEMQNQVTRPYSKMQI